jgi:hypothetical protein
VDSTGRRSALLSFHSCSGQTFVTIPLLQFHLLLDKSAWCLFGVLREYHRGAMDGIFTANISHGFWGEKFEDLAKIISLVAVM